ncbi:MAG: hypothetical protein JNK15_04250 [Planctomycetes bacterium]|nr:hypothetical protein [Planctomycetota bacterium]
MGCRHPHDLPPELAGLPPRAEFHALAMPRELRGDIDDALLECHRLPGLRLLRIYVPARALRGDAPLPLVLVNDGHKAFEPARSRTLPPWQQNGTLQLHRVMDGLLCTGAVRPAVVCAIATHASSRADHYVPVQAKYGDATFGGSGDTYLDLLEHEVVPAIRQRLRGVPIADAPRDRVLFGFSIGAVSALYGSLMRPHAFGAAIALSPSAWVDDGFLTRLARERGTVHARIAADVGAAERDPIRDHCRDLFNELRARGNGNVLAEEVAGVHHEDSWRERLPRLLQHVLGVPGATA